jgi:hypothetical protein
LYFSDVKNGRDLLLLNKMRTTFLIAFLLIVHLVNGQEIDFWDADNCFPKPEEIKKYKIKELILTTGKQCRDTIRYHELTGKIESELIYYNYSNNDPEFQLGVKKLYYYADTFLYKSIDAKYYWKSTYHGDSLRESSVQVIRYDSLGRERLHDHHILYYYIDSANVTYKIRKNLRWKFGDWFEGIPSNKYARYGADTTKFIYDAQHRLIRWEYPDYIGYKKSPNPEYYKTFVYEKNKITLYECRENFLKKKYDTLVYTIIYKKGKIKKVSCIGSNGDYRSGEHGLIKTEDTYFYRKGIIRKFIFKSNDFGGERTETCVKAIRQ